MEMFPTVHFYQIYPFSTEGYFETDTALLEIDCGHKITFRLAHNDVLASDRKLKYYCQDCKYYVDKDWFTSPFVFAKEMPKEAEEQMRKHSEDHNTLGAVAIKIYKQGLKTK